VALALIVLVAVLAALGVLIYNGLVRLRVLARNAWSDIDVQLKRRHDLIPNIVEIVRGYASYERGTLDAVVKARAGAMAAQGPGPRGEAEGTLTAALGRLFALAEAYPQLRAVEAFGRLQSTLTELEDAIQNARRYYNAVVRDFNTKVEQFPSNLIAGLFGFRALEFFQLPDAAEGAVPQVDVSGRAPETRP
jgi:LemA protein